MGNKIKQNFKVKCETWTDNNTLTHKTIADPNSGRDDEHQC